MSVNASQVITNVFVLMLENRSFDHMLGFSGITGTDAVTKQPTKINGLSGTESNSYLGIKYPVQQPAGFTMPVDPGHEFLDTVVQLSGNDGTYPPGGPYPPINNTGFVKNYVTTPTPNEGHPAGNYGEIMKCYSGSQLPVLNALAKEFAVCDNWCSSIPGPTWPNRFFLHAASSGGLDHSPTTSEISDWQSRHGYAFQNGSIFDRLNRNWRIYRGENFVSDIFPPVTALKGINFWDARPYHEFAPDISSKSYPLRYTFIEPSYGNILNNTYMGGTSQHPLDDVTAGERLIKETYEALRKSPLWKNSILIITWDEHGGFYDHVAPAKAVKPGDAVVSTDPVNKYGFPFDQYGVRVPAVIISPYIPKNVIDHRLYDHASVPATLEKIFGLAPLTQRDAQANNVTSLLSLTAARNTPTKLPEPAASGLAARVSAEFFSPARADVPANTGNVPGFLQSALSGDLELSPKAEHPAILARFKKIKSMKDAEKYMKEVMQKAQGSVPITVNQFQVRNFA
ncbi:MAG: Phosphoesterase [Segetibacter sp.]|nr:Phosphoesterase [Segetibacter sp.]